MKSTHKYYKYDNLITNRRPVMLRHKRLITLFYVLLMLCPLAMPATVAAAVNSYVIVLASAPGSDLNWAPKKSSLYKGRTLFIEKTTIKGKTWERLCLGFFNSRKQTYSVINKIQKIYPGAWVQKVSAKNIDRTLNQTTAKPVTTTKKTSKKAPVKAPVKVPTKTPVVNQSSLSDERLKSLMDRANADFKNKNYSSAVRYLTAVIAAGKHQYSQQALELLGLARQRKGQTAHAVDIYEKYLAAYPQGEGSDRVRQRLAGMLTAAKADKKKIDMKTVKTTDEITTYGSLSQFYRNNLATADGIGRQTTQSQLISYFDLTTLQKTSRFDHRYQVTVDHNYDFIDERDSSEFRFVETYYDLIHRKTGNSGRIGRQSLRIGGILKRFDGLSAGYQITPDMRINVLGGYAVDYDNKTTINTDKTFYGFIFETGTFLEHWNMSLFYIDQTYYDLTDRNSIGTDVRYRDDKLSLFGMVDYDIFYDEINVLHLNANLILDRQRTLYMNAFTRKAPVLATSNALIGQSTLTNIDELKQYYNIEQIYQLARDRTANSETITVGGTQQLNDKYQLTADITLTHLGSTPATPALTTPTITINEVPSTSGTGTDMLLSAQLVGNNLLKKHDTGILGLRYYDLEESRTISLVANTRYPITREWRINPRLQYDIRKIKSDGRSQKKLRAILRSDYRYLKQVRFDFEIGYDQTSDAIDGVSLDNNNLFFMLGYRWDF